MGEDDGLMRLDRREVDAIRKERNVEMGVRRVDAYTTIEETPEVKKDISQLLKDIDSLFTNPNYRQQMINDVLSKKHSIRFIYLILVKTHPAKIGDINELSYFTTKQNYNILYCLMKKYNLVYQISVNEISKKPKSKLSPTEKVVLKKFKFWTERMNMKQQQRFQTITHYWTLTQEGLDPTTIDLAIQKEKENKGVENVIDLDEIE